MTAPERLESEQRRDPAEVLKRLFELGEMDEKEKSVDHDGWLEMQLTGLPSVARQKILDYKDKIASIPNADDRDQLLAEKINDLRASELDTRFTVGQGEHMMKEGFSKEVATKWIADLLRPGCRPDDLKRIARLSFDGNGLKPFNDLAGSHAVGNEYLRRIAEVINEPNDRISQIFKDAGIREIAAVTGPSGGDEYSLVVKADQPITSETLTALLKEYQQAVAGLDVSDLINFDDEDVQLRYLGVPRVKFNSMAEGQKQELLRRFREEVPAGFRMPASISGGAATLFDGFERALNHDFDDDRRLTDDVDSFDRAVQLIRGGFWDVSEEAASENKSDFKSKIGETDPVYAKILGRTKEAREAEEAKNRLVVDNTRLKERVAELEAQNMELSRKLIGS